MTHPNLLSIFTNYQSTPTDEPPFVFADEVDFHGNVYPTTNPVLEYPLYDEWIGQTEIRLQSIRSMFIPHHSSLKLYNSNKGHASFHGPLTVPDVQAFLLGSWTEQNVHDDGAGEFKLTTKIDWSLNLSDGIHSLRVQRHKPWQTYVAERALKKPKLLTGDIDYEKFMQTFCAENPLHTECRCVTAQNEMMQQHPGAYGDSYVNLFDSNCNPDRHFMPATSRRGNNIHHCASMLKSQLSHGTFPLGPNVFSCGEYNFENVEDDNHIQAHRYTISTLEAVLYSVLSVFLLITLWLFSGLVEGRIYIKNFRIMFNNRNTKKQQFP
jgi:hypothetical protein